MTTHPFRAALAGVDHQALRRIRSLERTDEVDLVAIADADLDRAHALGGELDVPAFDSVAGMLDACEADGLIVATPQDSQIAVSSLALRRGTPILCEKPVGGAVSDVPRLLRLGHGLTLATGYELPFMVPPLHELSDPRRIGELDDIAAWAIGLPAAQLYPPFWSAGHGADALADLLSLVVAITQADPVRVRAAVHRIYSTVDFAGGTRATLRVVPETDTSFEPGILVRVSGNRGHVQIPLAGADEDRELAALAAQTRNWVRACRGEEELRSRPEDADRISRVMAAIATSVQLGGNEVAVERPAL